MEFVKCLGHPEEFYNLLRFRMGGRRNFIPKMDQVSRASLLPRRPVAASCTRGLLRMVSDTLVFTEGGIPAWVAHPTRAMSPCQALPPSPPTFFSRFLSVQAIAFLGSLAAYFVLLSLEFIFT